MPIITDQAIPIRLWDYSETSQTVSLFCRERGCIRGLAKGAKREKAPFSGGFELLTRGEVVAIVKRTTELSTVTEWHLQTIYWGARTGLKSFHAGIYMADLVFHAITDEDPHPALFDSFAQALEELADETHMLGVLRFQLALLTETGYRPRLDEPEGVGSAPAAYGFDPHSGCLTADPGPGGGGGERARRPWRVRAETVELLRRLIGGSVGMVEVSDSRGVDRSARLLAWYLRHVLQRDLPSRRMLFGD